MCVHLLRWMYVCFGCVFAGVCRIYGNVICVLMSFTGAGDSDVYMLKIVGERTPPCGTPVSN